jgi:hypothetical protein
MQHTHAGIVLVQHLALRRLPDQFFVRRFDDLGGLLDTCSETVLPGGTWCFLFLTFSSCDRPAVTH